MLYAELWIVTLRDDCSHRFVSFRSVDCITDKKVIFSFLANAEFWVMVPITVLKGTHQSRRRCVLTSLVLRSLDPGLQVSRWVEVLALVSAAAALNIVHADNDGVLTAVHHASLHGVSVAAVALTPRAVTALEFSTNLAESMGALINTCPSSY